MPAQKAKKAFVTTSAQGRSELCFSKAAANLALPTDLILLSEVSTVAKLKEECSDVGQTSNFKSRLRHSRLPFNGLKAALNYS